MYNKLFIFFRIFKNFTGARIAKLGPWDIISWSSLDKGSGGTLLFDNCDAHFERYRDQACGKMLRTVSCS